MSSCTLAIGHSQTAQLFGAGSVVGANNRTVIIEFRVDDVEAEYVRLKPFVDNWVKEPTTMPWGNRSMLFRDPDGNLLNLFEPVTEDAIKRFRGRH
ncbi:putative enzyme related to lactoylglutathione lyase [Paenibacillus harenae]|nr:putative enzyme related to lactoylglutathione lyase [Paenibacillus harenae]